MEEKCLRNMSCTCRLCAGEDISMLLNISKSISSNIEYEAGEDGDDAPPPPPPARGGITNSPPLPAARRALTNSPPLPAARRAVANSPPVPAAKRPPPMRRPPVQKTPVHDEPMEIAPAEDVTMAEDVAFPAQPPPSTTRARPPPAPVAPTRVPSPPAPEPMDTEMEVLAPPGPPLTSTPMPVAEMPSPSASPAASGEIPPVETLVGQLADKNWKTRKEAYDHIKALCQRPGTRGDDVAPLLELFPKACEDANASAMEAAIQAVLAYTQHVEPFHKGIVAGVMKRVVDKGFAGRPGTVKLCEELVSSFIEAGAAEDTVAALIEGTKNKKPKVPPACASCILEGIKAFGPRVVPVQTVKASLPALCESTVNGVRPVALNIIAEVHRWTGPALVADIVANLRQAQKTEYEVLTKDIVVGQAQPTKYVRGAKPPAQSTRGAAKSSGSGPAAGGSSSAFDPREFAETVNLLEKLPKTEFRSKLALPKWSEKVEALKIVLDVIGPVPKLANGEYYELVNTLKLLSNDSNVNIVAKAIEVLGALSDGLRKNFTQYARLMYPELMKKLSDKKSVVLNAVNNTLDMFVQHSMSIDMMMDEIRIGVDSSKNKAPQARVQTINFLSRCVEKKMVNIGDRNIVADFGGIFTNTIEDVDPTVRKAAVDALATLVKASPQTSEWTSGLMDDLSRKNPRSFKAVQQALGGAGGGSTPSSRPSSAGSVGRPAPDIVDTEMAEAPARSPAPSRAPVAKPRGPPSRLAGKAAEPAPKPAPAARKPGAAATGAGSTGSGGGDFAPFSIGVDLEEATSVLLDLQMESWGEITDGFASSKWTDRKAAIEHLEDYAKQNSSSMNVRVIEAMTLYLSKQVKDFKDSNINVLKSAFQAVGTFAENSAGKFPRGVVCLAVPSGVDKIADRKACETIRAMILQLCEAVGPTYVLGCIVNHMGNVKAPLAHAEVLTALSECVADFGVSLCSPRLLVDFAKGGYGLESSNPKVRSGAIALLGKMYSQLGPALLPILNLESWKPALASTVEAEFKKVGFDPANASANVKRQIKDADVLADGGKADAGALFGRVDISAQITKDLMADLKCEEDKTAWKKRLAAMDTVQSICEGAGCAIEFTKNVMELMKGMKARLTDSNANLKVKAAQVIGILATSIGPEVAKMSKMIVPALLGGVSDNKKNMQLAGIDALHKWVRHNNQTSPQCLESMLSSVAEAMANPVGRAELLGWLVEHLRSCDQRLDLSCLITPTVQGGLLDKSSEAREKAVQVLAEVMKSVGKDVALSSGCRDIKPAQMRSLKPMFDKAGEIAAASGAANVGTSSVSTPQPAAQPAAQAPVVPDSGTGARLGRTSSIPARSGPGGVARNQLSRAGGSFTAEVSSQAPDEAATSAGMLKMNGGKASRLAKGQFNKWIFDPISQSEMSNRKSEIEAEWRPFLAPQFHAKLFAPTLEKGMMAAMSDLMTCISSQPQEVLAALDWIFKWCTLRVVDNNVQALAKLLEVLVKLFELLKSTDYQLDEVEAAILLPYLLQESGNPKPRFRIRFRDIMRLVVDVYNTDSYVNYLVDCFNTSKNIRSRCECIDLIEHIVKVHGVNSVGKRSVKEIGKYVTAHEKEIRESAINALMAIYMQTGGDVDKFFRFTGVTSQQGMDLLVTKIKYLPPGSVVESSATLAPAQKSGFGFPAVAAQPSFSARTPPRMPTAANASTPMSGQKAFNNVPVAVQSAQTPAQRAFPVPQDEDDDDVVMTTPGRIDEPADPVAIIQDLLLRPLEDMFTEARDIVDEQSPAYEPGIQALKGLYTLLLDASEPAEGEFLRKHVNEIALRLCDCIHGSMGRGDPNKPLNMLPLTIALSTLRQLLESPAIEDIYRHVVERILLEMTSKLLDARFEDTPIHTDVKSAEFGAYPPERRRLIYMQKGLNAILAISTKRIKPGDLYPAIINLLQRIVRNDVGDYNARDSFNHLMHKDSLDQVMGRLLLKITALQAEALNPFEGIDIFGVLMQMHSFFGTLPQSDVFAVQIADDNMQQALKVIADCMMKTRQSVFETAVNDLPLDSPIRDLLARMGHTLSSQSSTRGLGSSRFGGYEASVSSTTFSTVGAPSFGGSSAAAPNESITRRLFDAGNGSSISNTPTASSLSTATRLDSFRSNGFGPASSFTATNDPNGHNGSRAPMLSLGDLTSEPGQPSTSQTLRERLSRLRAKP